MNLEGDFLLFADDVKLFGEEASYQQLVRLQEDLMKIEEWCVLNGMDLNPTKCLVITFSKSRQTHQFNYILQNFTLRRVTEVKDLGILLTANLDFGAHISNVCGKALKTLGLVNRICRQGLSASSLKTLYVALVRPIMEYSVVVWSPHQIGHCSSLDAVQRRFIRTIGVKLGYRYIEVGIQAMERCLNLPTLSSRRTLIDLMFLYKILNNTIDCSEILQMIDFHVPRSARHFQLFTIHHLSTNYLYHSAIPRLMRIGNAVSADLDFFGKPLSSFKRRAATILHELD
ncbi:uncharacterized protein LOC124354079 [Homalodisca vitripennis]|uniref:uncharacterized protein LOC124354079 n=1 Tax=Homalodisca vitripennis TaxID=197043 RepID=UPI001EEA8B8B|nr:uncharacterized protein LOC124354079 [Homalodisca vitripennis]